MSIERPTFSENWHRVAGMKPRLRAAVQTYRQQFRGRQWHVLADPANNQYFRLDEPAYHFVALLNGARPVAQVWDICNEELGDAAPTQGEVIRLLGQLYTSNLLTADLPPDAEQVFQRYRKRVRKEVGSYLMNFLFVRIPLFDPQRILERWVGVVGWLFGPVGFTMWLALLAVAGWHLAGRWREMWAAASPQTLLNMDNLLVMYLCFAVIKALHEFGHGFVCVRYGRKQGVPTTVHTVGIMLLVFMPVPYVDASSAWMLRSKWHRAYVGAAGMYVELAVAAVAAIIWARTDVGSPVHDICYNLIFIASISTILFNGNPLLRFDGYYILSDLLEFANLQQRSKQYLYYAARKFAFGVRHVPRVAHATGEAAWLGCYAVAAFAYRVLICVGILMYVSQVFFIFGVLMAIAAVVTWVVVPIGKFVKYLMTSPELERTRSRAIGATLGVVVPIIVFIGLVPVPDRDRAEGVVEPIDIVVITTETDGFVTDVLPSGTPVEPDGKPILNATNNELEAERRQLLAQRRIVMVQREQARGEDPAVMQARNEQLQAIGQRLDRVNRDLAALRIRPPFPGVWVSDQVDSIRGVYLKRGQEIGMVADPSSLLIRFAADQRLGPRIGPEIGIGDDAVVEMRVPGRPDLQFTGTIRQLLPAGQQQLPSAALGYVAGGSIAVAMDDQSGRKASEYHFEVHVRPDLDDLAGTSLRIGQRVVARFEMPPRPLAVQWWRSLRQLVQQHFSIQI